MDLPQEDRTRSPHTGWTRAHWEAMADRLLEAVVPHATPGFAQVRLPGRTSRAGVTSDGLEGFARTFLLAGLRIAGDRGETPRAKILIERYAEGLAAGTDPGNRYAWPPITDYSQPIVEAASVALMLAETRPWLWDQLGHDTRRAVHRWLEGIVGSRPWPCNWLLFQVVVEQFLADTGGRFEQAEIDGGLDAIEDWYRGDGWYSDGAGQHFDHYAGWAMHLYPLLWARMPGAAGDTGRIARYRERLHAFLGDFRLMFGADGAPMHQGRSLTYRYAAAAALWTGALADATPLPPGETRRLASGALRYFAERGAPDAQGLLRLGYHCQFLPITQPYSGPASPYWAAKGFVGLLLPADHPAWTATEEPAAVERGDFARALPAPGWLLHGTRADGVVRLYNHGSDHIKVPAELGDDPERDDPHYAKIGYSTHTAPETEAHAWSLDMDGHTGLTPPGGGPVTRRRRIHRIGVADGFAASSSTDGDVTVETASVLCGAGELRIDRVTAPAGWVARTGGFAVAGASTPAGLAHGRTAEVVGPAGLTCRIVGLAGWSGAGVQRMSGANAFGDRSATPYLTADPHPGGSVLHVALVTLAGRVPEPVPQVTAQDDEVVAVFADGTEVRVRLGAAPRYSRRPPPGGGPSITWDPTVP